MDGARYAANIELSVRSGLNYKGMFLKDCMNNYRLNESMADKQEKVMYEHYKTKRIEYRNKNPNGKKFYEKI